MTIKYNDFIKGEVDSIDISNFFSGIQSLQFSFTFPIMVASEAAIGI